ncbi:MAG: hypothetical protein R3A10_04600 [Caldilineaceae bacterium]
MVVNRTLQIMKEGKPAFGFAAGLGSPLNAELLSRSGIDFILLDRQHGSWGDDTTIQALSAMHGNGATPMARGPQRLHAHRPAAGRGDDGHHRAHGPHDRGCPARSHGVPLPAGGRPFVGWGRAWSYGSDYSEWINEQIFVAVQIESAGRGKCGSHHGHARCGRLLDRAVGPGALLGFHPREMHDREEHAGAGGHRPGLSQHGHDSGIAGLGLEAHAAACRPRLPVHHRGQ